jgi:hypothetical protein
MPGVAATPRSKPGRRRRREGRSRRALLSGG